MALRAHVGIETGRFGGQHIVENEVSKCHLRRSNSQRVNDVLRQAATTSFTTEANKPVDKTGGDPIGRISDYHEGWEVCPTQIAPISQVIAPHKVSRVLLSAAIKMGRMVAKEGLEPRAGIFVDQDVKEWSAPITPWEKEKALATELGITALKHKVRLCGSQHDYEPYIFNFVFERYHSIAWRSPILNLVSNFRLNSLTALLDLGNFRGRPLPVGPQCNRTR